MVSWAVDIEQGLVSNLVNLPPLICSFLCEAMIDHWHDFIQQLTDEGLESSGRGVDWEHQLVEGAIGDLLHQCRGCAPTRGRVSRRWLQRLVLGVPTYGSLFVASRTLASISV
jgi:hypothetical protein